MRLWHGRFTLGQGIENTTVNILKGIIWTKRLFLLSVFIYFAFSCFAYDIELYSEQVSWQFEQLFNLVFCPLNYRNKEDLSRDMKVLIQRLSKTKPFNEVVERIRVYYINLSREEENTILKRTQGFPPLKVRQDFLDGISAYLKSNYKLIIIDASGFSSCTELSSIDKTSLIILGRRRYKNEHSFARGFLHELGHSLGLRDECVNCQELCPAGPPNCAPTKEEAKRWWGKLVGSVPRVHYIRGCCGDKDYIRPTIASLMNDPDKAEDFGPVNERYLKNILEGLSKK